MDKCLYILDSVLAIDHEMIPLKFDVVNQCLPEFIRVLYGSMNDSRASQNHSETQPSTQNKSWSSRILKQLEQPESALPGNIMTAHLPLGRSFEEFVSLRISSVLYAFFFIS